MSRTSNKSSHHHFHPLDTKTYGGSLIKEAFEALGIMDSSGRPALDGRPGNSERLKNDLTELGVFDRGMSSYLLIKPREYLKMGFSGFESRQYSLFESLGDDMANAVNLQQLIKAFAFKLIAEGSVTHHDIPDTPHVESERRQMFFGEAIGITSFYVRKDTKNNFLLNILKKTKYVRSSTRYPNYLKVKNSDYRLALAKTLLEGAGELTEMLGLRTTIDDLIARLQDDTITASGKLTKGILKTVGAGKPLAVKATEFNIAAERYYRTDLCLKHMVEAFSFLEEDFSPVRQLKEGERTILKWILGTKDAVDFLKECKDDITNDRASEDILSKMISIVVLSIHQDTIEAGNEL